MVSTDREEDTYDGSATAVIPLLLIEKKSALVKHCRSMVIRMNDFVELILAAEMGLLPWRHARHNRDYIPQHLHPTKEEIAGLGRTKPGQRASPAAQKFMRKIAATFDERRLLVGHMFSTEDAANWHFFYFDQRDTQHDGNHWVHGPHIHYLNYLWPERTAHSTWQEFVAGNPTMRSALHIRWSEEG